VEHDKPGDKKNSPCQGKNIGKESFLSVFFIFIARVVGY